MCAFPAVGLRTTAVVHETYHASAEGEVRMGIDPNQDLIPFVEKVRQEVALQSNCLQDVDVGVRLSH